MKLWHWLTSPWAIGVWIGVAMLASCLFWLDLVDMANQNEGLAAWMQAAFSVLAIMFAAKLNYRERLKNRQERMEALRGLMLAAETMVKHMRERFDEANETGRAALQPRCDERFDEVLILLSEVPVMDLGSTKAPTVILEMKRVVRDAKALWGRETQVFPSPLSAASLLTARELEKQAAELVEQVEAWLEYRARRAKAWLFN